MIPWNRASVTVRWTLQTRVVPVAALVALLFAGLYFSYSQSSYAALFVVVLAITLVAGDRRARRVALVAAVAVLLVATGIAALDDEVGNHSYKRQAVIKAAAREADKIVHRHRSIGHEQFYANVLGTEARRANGAALTPQERENPHILFLWPTSTYHFGSCVQPQPLPLSKGLGVFLIKGFDFTFELRGLFVWLALSLILGAVASVIPAWRAAQQPIREALGYE